MSQHALLRRAASGVVATIALLSAGPLVGVASAATPARQSSSPAAGATVKPPATVSATYDTALDTAASTIQVFDPDMQPVPGGKSFTNTNHTIVFTPTDAADLSTEGSYDVQLVVRDGATGPNLPSPDSFSYTVDSTSPVLGDPSITNPVTSANQTAVNVAGTAESGAAIHISIDDANAGTAPVVADGTATGGNYSINLDVTSLDDGTLTAAVTASDAAGNTTTKNVQTTKQATPPILVSRSPAADSRVKTVPKVSATYDEPLNTVTSTIVVTDDTGTPLSGAKSFTNTNHTIVFTPTDTLGQAGSPYSVVVTAKDAQGTTTTTMWSFIVDTEAPAKPTAVVISPDPINAASQSDVTVSGSAEAGSSVSVSVDDASNGGTAAVTGATTAGEDRGFAVHLNVTSLSDGVLTATVEATDVAGNVGESETDTATKDASPPTVVTVALAPQQVGSADDQAVHLTGTTSEPGVTVNYSINDTDGTTPAITGTTPADGSSAFSKDLDVTPLSDGTLTVTVSATDIHGNTGPTNTATTTMDATAPVAPSVTISPKPINAANVASVTISGTAENGRAVHIDVSDTGSGHVTGDVTSNADTGAYSKQLDLTPLADGTVTATVTVKDAFENTSPAGTDTATKDVVKPTTPTVNLSPSPVSAGPLTVSGTTSPGASVHVSVDDAGAPGTNPVTADTTADGSGAYTVQVAITSLQDGDLTATVIATDGAGNPSDPGTGHVMKDTGAPDAPSVVITPSSINSGNANAVTVSGDTEPGNAVHISVDDTDTATSALTGDTFANGAGHYSLPFDMTSLSDGTITATATAKDAANNIGPSGQGTATKNTGAPQLVSTSPAANSTVQPPADVRATFNEPLDQAQSTLVVKNKNNNTVAGTTTFAPGGRTIIFTPSSALTDAGSPYTATYNVKDVVDNNTTGSFTFTVDSVPPAAPTSVLLSPDPIGPTNMAAVTGSAQPGSTVNVSVDDTFGATPPETGQTTAAENGSFSVPINVSTLGDGVLTATVTATDAAGNTGPSATDTATKDTTSPTGTTVTKSPTAANIVTSPAITISGTTEPLASVLISIGDGGVSTPLTFTTAADGTGNYSHTFDVTPLTDGTLTVLATATDAAGNSAAAASTTMPKDTVAPNAPTLVLPAKVTHANVASVPFSGTAEEASALIMTVNDASTATPQIVGQTTVGNDGAWSLTRDLRPLRNGTLTVKAAVRDAVGNMSPITTKSLAKDSRPTTTLSLTVFPSTVTDGAAVRMFGTLKDQDGVKLGGKTVTLTYVSSPQTRRFAVTTKSDGTYSLTTKLHYNGRITATFAADSVAKGSASVPRSLTVRRQVVVQSPANGATVPAGSLITIKGYITPITSGLNIALSESGVGDIGYAKTAPDGTFSLREAFAKGRHVLTVRVSGTGANARNSRTFVITAQ